MSEETTVPLEELRDRVAAVLAGAGGGLETVRAMVSYVVDAEISGRRTHGLQRLDSFCSDVAAHPEARPRLAGAAPGVLYVHADGAPGIVAAQACVDAVLEDRSNGPVVVAATGYVGGNGALGYFTRQLAAEGRVALMVTNCESGVAPAGGVEPILGTNPLAWSFPFQDRPVTIDMATSAVSYGQLALLARAGEPAPPGTVIDRTGAASADPGDADRGAQLPMAGHKGYGLGLLIELLAGPMIGAKAGRARLDAGDGLVLYAHRVDVYRDRGRIDAESAELLDDLVTSRPLDPARPVRIPGHSAEGSSRTAADERVVAVAASAWRDLVERTGA